MHCPCSRRVGQDGNPYRNGVVRRAKRFKSSRLQGSPYAEKLIAEKQECLRSISEGGSCELGNEEEVLESESGDRNMATEFGEVVLVGLADLFDDPVKAKAFE